jgi:DmsE family decaheme c-type cytochrome
MSLTPPCAGSSPAPVPVAKRRHGAALAPVLVTAAFTLANLLAGAQAAPQQPAAPAPANAPAEYVGSQVCQGCHEDLFNALRKSPHEAVESSKKRGWEGKACESCHGPGSKHAESASVADIVNPAKLKPAETDRVCLKCHLNTPTHVGRIEGSHARNEVGCTSCHAIHKHGPNGLIPRGFANINMLCANCHPSVWAQFQRPYKHRLPEGAMSCVDCHNPHGTLKPHMLQLAAGNEPGCIKCHAEKRGPFTYEHAVLRLEGCTACHEPHGSANPRMLSRQEVRLVCLECHANLPVPQPAALGVVPPAFHDLRSPRFRNCTICHQKIHGSYVDRNLLR